MFTRAWTEVPRRLDAEGVSRECTAADNLEVLTEHNHGIRGRLRLSTTARKKEEVWTARCEDGTLRVGADDRAVLVENFGDTTEIPASRNDVLASVDLAGHAGLRACPDVVFPALVLLVLFLRGDPSVPSLHDAARCMELLAT